MLIHYTYLRNILSIVFLCYFQLDGLSNFYVVHDSPILTTKDSCQISLNFANSSKKIDVVKFILVDENNKNVLKRETKPSPLTKKISHNIPRKILLKREHQYLFKVFYSDQSSEERKGIISNKLNKDGLVPFLVNRKVKGATKANTFRLIIALDRKHTPDSVNYCIKNIIDTLFETNKLLSKYSMKFDFFFTEECAEIRRGKGLYHHINQNVLNKMNITTYTGIGIIHENKKFRDYYYASGTGTKLFSASILRPHVFTHELLHMLFSLSDEYEEKDYEIQGHEKYRMNPVYPNMFTDRFLAISYCKQNNISQNTIKSVRTNNGDSHDWHKICNNKCIMNGPRPNEIPSIGVACSINIENHLKNKR